MQISNPYHEGELEVQKRANESDIARSNGVVIDDAILAGLPVNQRHLSLFDHHEAETVMEGALGVFRLCIQEFCVIFEFGRNTGHLHLTSSNNQGHGDQFRPIQTATIRASITLIPVARDTLNS